MKDIGYNDEKMLMRGTTIAAISTAAGEAGIGVVRMTGPQSLEIAQKVFSGKLENRRMIFGRVIDPGTGKNYDEVLCVYMKAPHSYTGEDVVEFQCHGSVIVIKNILELLLRSGAEPAERGEFTKRAFLNGRMDLSQAEAVIDLIKARSSAGSTAALAQLEGVLSGEVSRIRKEMMDLLVRLAVNIDYPDEDIEQINYKNMKKSLSSIGDALCKLKDSAAEGKIIREGLSVAITGKPNVGKSSLMNAFLKENRSIVTDIPGTTRDTIEEQASVRGIAIKFIDTAGIHNSKDKIESIGIERSRLALSGADLALIVLDASKPLATEDYEILKSAEELPHIIVLNKTDITGGTLLPDAQEVSAGKRAVKISAKEGFGLEKLESEIEDFITGGHVRKESDPLLTNVRHIRLVEKALDEIKEAGEMCGRFEAMDFIEFNVKAAFDYLGEIIGETAKDQIIDEVFSRFCLGK
jgi:tRNA modification GTPase